MSIDGGKSTDAAISGRFQVEGAGRWVTGLKHPPPHAGEASADAPTDQLLIDRQLFPKKNAQFSRHAQRLNTAQGVEAMSQVSLDFDPATETLVVHSVRIWRDGVATEHADAGRFKLIQRESNLERQLYDGRMSALLLLEDVRVGDVIDIASTRTGDHSELASHFFAAFSAEYPVPVRRWSASALVGEDSPLRWRCSPEDKAPVSRELKGGWTLHRWCENDMPACEFEPNAPHWHLQGGAIEFSDFTDWAEVAQWITKLWGKPEVPAALKDIARDIVKETDDEVERANRAVAFVRDEIRYLGLEDGIGSLQPCTVDDVLRRRFGDCKDKSRLLCLLLRLLKIPASPMLVNTVAGRAVEQMLPSPSAFDHVIVCAKVAQCAIWIDPTRRSLAKSVLDLPSPSYGFALPVSAKAKDLRAIPATPSDAALLVVKETYKVKDRESPVALTIQQTASGFEAEHLREVFGSVGKTRYRELREAQMREAYPGAKAVGEWEADVGPDALTPTSIEHFEISEFVYNAGDGSHAISFSPNSLRGRLPGSPHNDDRKAPWALPYPCRIRHESSLELPTAIPDSDENHTIDSETFGYKTSLDVKGDKAQAVFRYWTKADHVRPDQIATYRADVDQMTKYTAPILQLTQSPEVWKKPKSGEKKPKRRSETAEGNHDHRRHHHHTRSTNKDAQRKKLALKLGTLAVVGTVIAVFSNVQDKGKIPEPTRSKTSNDPTLSAEYRAVYGTARGALPAEGTQPPAIDVPDPDLVPAPAPAMSELTADQKKRVEEDSPFGGSLLGEPYKPSDDQPDELKYQDLKNLDLKL